MTKRWIPTFFSQKKDVIGLVITDIKKEEVFDITEGEDKLTRS